MSFKNPDRLVILIASGMKADILLAHLARENFNFIVIKSTGILLQEPEVSCWLVSKGFVCRICWISSGQIAARTGIMSPPRALCKAN